MSTPATLPAEFFKADTKAPDTLPAEFFEANNSAPETEQPKSTYQKLTEVDQTTANPVLRTLSNAGAAVLSAPEGLYNTLRHPINTAKGMLSSVVDAGKFYSDPATRPTLEGLLSVGPEAIGLGIGNAAVARGGPVVGAALKGAGKMIPSGGAAQAIATRAYQSALKPPPGSYTTAEVGKIVNTGLENAIPISKGGLEKIGDLVADLNDKVSAQIKAGSQAGVTLSPSKIASRTSGLKGDFATQVNPESDLAAIDSSKAEFLRNFGGKALSAEDAQKLKVGTYKQLYGKYGELGSATTESQKALARGIKEELQTQFPEIQGLNAQEGKLLELQPAIDRAVRRINNHDLMSLGGKMLAGAAGTAIGAATGSAEGAGMGAAAAMALHYVATDPFVQSKLAIALFRANKGKISFSTAKTRVLGYAAALGNAANATSAGPVDQNNQ